MEIPPPGLQARPTPLAASAAQAAPPPADQAVEAVVTAVRPRAVNSAAAGFLLELDVPGIDTPLEASSARSLEPGTRLVLRFTGNGSARVERVIDPSRPPLPDAPAQQALREALPRQQPLAEAYGDMARLLRAGSLPEEVKRSVEKLLNALPTPALISTATGLRAAIANSGTFLEARLQRGDAAAPTAQPQTPGKQSPAPRSDAAMQQTTAEAPPAAPGSAAAKFWRLLGRAVTPAPAQSSGATRQSDTTLRVPTAERAGNQGTEQSRAAISRETGLTQQPGAFVQRTTPGTPEAIRAPVTDTDTTAPPGAPTRPASSPPPRSSGSSLARDADPARAPQNAGAPGGHAKSNATSVAGLEAAGSPPSPSAGARYPAGNTPDAHRQNEARGAGDISRRTSQQAPHAEHSPPIDSRTAPRLTAHPPGGATAPQALSPGAPQAQPSQGPAPTTGKAGASTPLPASAPGPMDVGAPVSEGAEDADFEAALRQPLVRHAARPLNESGTAAEAGVQHARYGATNMPALARTLASDASRQTSLLHPSPSPPADRQTLQGEKGVRATFVPGILAPSAGGPEAGVRPANAPLTAVGTPPGTPRSASAPPPATPSGQPPAADHPTRHIQSRTEPVTTSPASIGNQARDRMPRDAPGARPQQPGSTGADVRRDSSGRLPDPAPDPRRSQHSAAPVPGAQHSDRDLKADLKASLAELRGMLVSAVRSTTSGPPAAAGVHQGAPPDGGDLYTARGLMHRSSGAVSAPGKPGAEGRSGISMTAAANASLEELMQKVEGALARTRVHQLVTLQDSRQGNEGISNTPVWTVELPIPTPSGFDSLWLRVEEHADNRSSSTGETRDWSVMLCLDCASLGPLHALVRLQGLRLTTTLWAERESTLLTVRSAVAELEEALRAQGVDVERVDCRPGRPPEPAALRFGNLLDVRT